MFAFYEGAQKSPKAIFGQCILIFSSLDFVHGHTPNYPLSLGVPLQRTPLSAAPSALEFHQIMSPRFCFARRNCGDSRALPPVRILTLP
jgi:hypothetical protein